MFPIHAYVKGFPHIKLNKTVWVPYYPRKKKKKVREELKNERENRERGDNNIKNVGIEKKHV